MTRLRVVGSAARRGREAALERKRRNADRDQWHGAETLSELGEVTARWLEGDIVHNPSYNGRPDPEIDVIAAPLAAANRSGFVTGGSQPGGTWDGWVQRAAVDGFADDATRERLLEVATRHGLTCISHKAPMLRTDYGLTETVTVTRLRPGDDPEVWNPHTNFGAALSRYTVRDGLIITANEDVLDEAAEVWQVTLMDPDWGSNASLVAALDEFSGRTSDGPTSLFSHEQVVEHATWKDADGQPQRGVIRWADPLAAEPPALEVAWDGCPDAFDDLDRVAADLRPYVPPGLPVMTRPASCSEVAVSLTAFGYADGAEVQHMSWTDPAGRPLRGKVRVLPLTPDERAEGGYAEAEVRWVGAAFPTELDSDTAKDLRPLAPAPASPTAEQIAEMRDWISDCTWGDLDPEEIDDLPDEAVVRGVDTHYDGGVAGFLADLNPPPPRQAPGATPLPAGQV